MRGQVVHRCRRYGDRNPLWIKCHVELVTIPIPVDLLICQCCLSNHFSWFFFFGNTYDSFTPFNHKSDEGGVAELLRSVARYGRYLCLSGAWLNSLLGCGAGLASAQAARCRKRGGSMACRIPVFHNSLPAVRPRQFLWGLREKLQRQSMARTLTPRVARVSCQSPGFAF